MISLVFCSRQPSLSKELEQNISRTIGTGYETVVINNSQTDYSIFEAYNLGISRSKGDILIFLHDDLLFQSNGWGSVIERIFLEKPDVGLLGVAGSTIKTKMPSSWWISPGSVVIRLIQHHKDGRPSEDKNSGFMNLKLIEVAAIDGVFMAMKKDKRITFDTELDGFHNYDLDLSLKHHLLNKKVCVTNEIVIEHFSGGTIDKNWYLSASRFHKKNSVNLPVIRASAMGEEELSRNEFGIGAGFVKGLLRMNLKREAIYWWMHLVRMKIYSKFHLRFIRLFFSTLEQKIGGKEALELLKTHKSRYE